MWSSPYSMRGNQVPVSATRWQHGSQICFTTFYLLKSNKKNAENSTTTKAREKINTDLESSEF
jgi:hypothetical protein